MSGKRLLDAIQLLNAAKSVAGKHLAVRQRQLDVYTRTSSLTKGVKQQADNLILTAQAAAALARRFNEPPPPTSAPSTQPVKSPYDQGQTTKGDVARIATSVDNTSVNYGLGERSSALSAEEAGKLQRQESQIPGKQAEHSLDGSSGDLTVSKGQDIFYTPSSKAGPVHSALPTEKVPKVTGDVQEGGDGKINSDVFYSPVRRSNEDTVSESKVVSESDEPSEDMMRNIFRSPRVANMLLSKEKRPYAWNAPSNTTAPTQAYVEGKDDVESTSQVRVQDAQEDASKESSVSSSALEHGKTEQLGSTSAESLPSSQEVRASHPS